MKLILGTMTFGESVFRPDVDAFINAFLDAGYVLAFPEATRAGP